jgi:hypothetical protein
MKRIITAVSIVAVSVAGTVAFAADERKSSDASSAGATSEQRRTAGGVSVDLMKDLANAFEKADKDRDGKLDPAEYRVLQAEVNIKG